METQFCRTCGQANLISETVCSKCGLNIGKTNQNAPNRNPFVADEDVYKTIIVAEPEVKNARTSAKSTQPIANKSNKKLLWILGIVGALVLFGGFLIVALAGGIYFYTANHTKTAKSPKPLIDEKQEKENSTPPKNEQNTTNAEETDALLSQMKDEDINKHINRKLNPLGTYRLGKSGTPKEKYFVGSNAEQYGLYFPKNAKKEFVLFSMATFTSTRKAKEYVSEKANQIVKDGGKIISHTDKATSDILLFNEKGTGGQIIDCKDGIRINITATTAKDTSGFYKAYYSRK